MPSQTANKDENGVSTLIAPLNTNPNVIKRVNGLNGGMKIIESAITTSFPKEAPKDENDVSCLLITSSTDRKPMVASSTDSGELLVKIIA